LLCEIGAAAAFFVVEGAGAAKRVVVVAALCRSSLSRSPWSTKPPPTICPSAAIFLISATVFFSCVCKAMRSRSSSRIARSSIRLFSRSISAGVFFLPKSHSMALCDRENFGGGGAGLSKSVVLHQARRRRPQRQRRRMRHTRSSLSFSLNIAALSPTVRANNRLGARWAPSPTRWGQSKRGKRSGRRRQAALARASSAARMRVGGGAIRAAALPKPLPGRRASFPSARARHISCLRTLLAGGREREQRERDGRKAPLRSRRNAERERERETETHPKTCVRARSQGPNDRALSPLTRGKEGRKARGRCNERREGASALLPREEEGWSERPDADGCACMTAGVVGSWRCWGDRVCGD
jgi:hypothetical protein